MSYLYTQKVLCLSNSPVHQMLLKKKIHCIWLGIWFQRCIKNPPKFLVHFEIPNNGCLCLINLLHVGNICVSPEEEASSVCSFVIAAIEWQGKAWNALYCCLEIVLCQLRMRFLFLAYLLQVKDHYRKLSWSAWLAEGPTRNCLSPEGPSLYKLQSQNMLWKFFVSNTL